MNKQGAAKSHSHHYNTIWIRNPYNPGERLFLPERSADFTSGRGWGEGIYVVKCRSTDKVDGEAVFFVGGFAASLLYLWFRHQQKTIFPILLFTRTNRQKRISNSDIVQNERFWKKVTGRLRTRTWDVPQGTSSVPKPSPTEPWARSSTCSLVVLSNYTYRVCSVRGGGGGGVRIFLNINTAYFVFLYPFGIL